MKREFSFDRSSFFILYNKYREYLVFLFILLISIVLFLFFLIPQIQNLLTEKKQEEIYKAKIQTIQNNLQFVGSLDDNQLNSQIQLVSAVLPPDKDFVAILNAISSSAGKAGVSIGDFSLQIGILATGSAQNITVLPSIPVKLVVTGKTENIIALLSNFEKTMPISQSDSIEIGGQSATFTQAFSYRLQDQLPFNPNSPISPLSKEEIALLKVIRSWSNRPIQNSPNLLNSQESLSASSSSAFFSP